MVFRYFTLLAILIACLGLFGLAVFIAEQRKREIGIRKVLGATTAGLTFKLVVDFTKWVLIANFIALPVGYYFINKGLQNFAYRVDITIWIFLFSALLSLFIAVITVIFQALRASLKNPVDTLKIE